MNLQPSFYFRPLKQDIVLSHLFNITLRNPKKDELPIFEQSLKNLSLRLSDKERKRILYTLYPLGNFSTEGTVEEQFIRELSKIWIIVSCEKELPFERGLVDYGFLCGYISDQQYMRNPGGFVADIHTITPRELLRALKKELPKAAQLILTNTSTIEDIHLLQSQTTFWDGILSKGHLTSRYIQLAKHLRLAHDSLDPIQEFINYCIVTEILLVHNPSKNDSKMPINRQFVSKLTLLRQMIVILKNQQLLRSSDEVADLCNTIYNIRSEITHGRHQEHLSKHKIASYINFLFPTIRSIIELQNHHRDFVDFIKKI